jgi:Ca2+-binding RTX toxin-like protein
MTEGSIGNSRRLMLSLGDRFARHSLVGICVGNSDASRFRAGQNLEEGIEVHHQRGELRQDACVALDTGGPVGDLILQHFLARHRPLEIGSVSSGDDTLIGTALADTQDGLGGNDTIVGLAGNESLIGGAGKDSLVGGLGLDTLDYAIEESAQGDTLGVLVNFATGNATDAFGDADTFSGFEAATGTSLADEFVGSNAAETIEAGGGDDRVTARGGNNVLFGGLGADSLFGQAGDDTIDGGDDLLNGAIRARKP